MPTLGKILGQQTPVRYASVPSLQEEDASEKGYSHDIPRTSSQRPNAALWCSIGLNVFFAAIIFFWLNTTQSSNQGALYSPAQHILEREDVVFKSSFGNQRTEYQGPPNAKNNALWHDLYSYGISRLSAEEASPMVNKTLPIPGDDNHYITSLAVMHQLHCLNMVRKGLYGDVDWTNKDDLRGIEHLDHCVDIIRQQLMCKADVTPLTWVRDPADGKAKEVAQVVHTCHNFQRVRDWVMDHKLRVEFDYDTVVTDDVLGWGSYEIDEEFPL